MISRLRQRKSRKQRRETDPSQQDRKDDRLDPNGDPRPRKKPINSLLENRLIDEVSFEEYRSKVRDVYDGPQGAVLLACSMISLHWTLGERIFRQRKFDLLGVRNILDVGSGAGQISSHLMKYADPQAQITCFDLSAEMVRRARRRMRSDEPNYLVADLTRLPFADASFDCVTCGYVLEHLPDAKLGLGELARVLTPGGRMLLLTTEDNFGGAWTSRVWRCRTYNRKELMATCDELGLHWKNELWFTPMHKLLKAGGICVEIQRRPVDERQEPQPPTDEAQAAIEAPA